MNRRILNSQWFKYAAMMVIGLFLGWLMFKDSDVAHVGHDHDETTENTIWTCSMHPHIRQPEPGKCPLCGMDLIPASVPSGGGGAMSDLEYEMTPQAMALANVGTSVIGTARAENQLNLIGRIQADEQRVASIAATFAGRVEQLYVNFTGQEIKKGQRLASIYSPEMITAQKELQEAARTKSANPVLYDAARERLRSWRFTDAQIDAIEETDRVRTEFDIYADRSGVVISRLVSVGDYVGRGGALFELVDLNQLWVMLDAYESDLAWINVGDQVNFTVSALPGQQYSAKITYIDPIINPATRAASVRAETNNRDGRLKPEMFVNATISASIKGDTESLVIPRTAVLWTGQRSLVYVKLPDREHPTFEMREITLGPRMDQMFVVEEGLRSGEEIVTNGVFSVDAAAQLQGRVSMMNPTGGRVGTVHDHGQVDSSHPAPDTEHSGHEPLEKFHGVNAQFKAQLTGVYENYLNLKNALVDSDPGKAQKMANETRTALDKVDMGLVKGEQHDVWMERMSAMASALDNMKGQGDLERQRNAFSTLSEALYKSLVQFDVEGIGAYYQHCPMALNDKGANWLSEKEEIRNPYFGESMLTCGWTEEKIE
jgi:membrane fusion protein, copper/silver efflux system